MEASSSGDGGGSSGQVLHQELLLALNADCAEFFDGSDEHSSSDREADSGDAPLASSSLLAAATYELDAAAGRRDGRLYLYTLQLPPSSQPRQQQQQQQEQELEAAAAPAAAAEGPSLRLLAELDAAGGIFDARWAPAAAAAAGAPRCDAAGGSDGEVAAAGGGDGGGGEGAGAPCGSRRQQRRRRQHIGLALSDGTLRLVAVDAAAPEDGARTDSDGDGGSGGVTTRRRRRRLREVARVQAASEGMALAVDWAPPYPPPQQQQQNQQQQPADGDEEWAAGAAAAAAAPPCLAAVVSSAGTVSVVAAREAALQVVAEWRAHDLEVWMAAWDRHTPHLLYSGGDDAAFKGWDVRLPLSSGGCSGGDGSSGGGSSGDGPVEPAALRFSDRRTHGAGVTCVASHPRRPHALATGSYDESVRLWDARAASGGSSGAAPRVAAELQAGGGVWRLKWHPHDDARLLAACMYGGFAVLRAVAFANGGGGGVDAGDAADGGGGSSGCSGLEVVERYGRHDSIAYGADWYRGGAGGGGACFKRDVVATCSFYDRRLHLWSPASAPASHT